MLRVRHRCCCGGCLGGVGCVGWATVMGRSQRRCGRCCALFLLWWDNQGGWAEGGGGCAAVHEGERGVGHAGAWSTDGALRRGMAAAAAAAVIQTQKGQGYWGLSWSECAGQRGLTHAPPKTCFLKAVGVCYFKTTGKKA
eukprot:1142574-Pelagomonas_calceolata.AAC.4